MRFMVTVFFFQDRGTHQYDLVCVGHSLGAGTAAILAILLRQEYPNLHCYSFSPPGGLLRYVFLSVKISPPPQRKREKQKTMRL